MDVGRYGRWSTPVLVAAIVAGGANPAVGDRLARNKSAKETSVMARERSAYDPMCVLPDFGLEDGPGPPLLVCPRISLTGGYSDNVFRTQEDAQADVFTRVAPRISVQTDWLNHAIALDARGEFARYADTQTNDYNDGQINGRGRLDLTEEASTSLDLGVARLHEDRGDPDSPPGIVNVNTYDLYRQRVSFDYRPSDIFFNASVEAREYDWRDNGPIDNDVRDRAQYDGTFRLGYRLTEETSAFVRPSYNIRRYDQERDAFGFKQDSQGWDTRVGLLYDVSALTFLDLSAGYFQQSYEDPRFDTISGVSAGLEFTWNVTDLATVTAGIDRGVEETVTQGTAGIVRTSGRLGLDYELDYDMIAHLSGQYARSDFDGISRSDDTYQARVGLSYLMNAYFSVDVSYRYDRRDSTLDASDYSANSAFVTLRAQY